MSIAAMNHVDQNVAEDMPSGMYFVLFRLADRGSDHSGEDWTCFPSVEDLSKKTRLSRSAVERHLQALVMEGWISRKRRIRPDGTKGIYDYTIHSSNARRAALKAARAAIKAAGEKLKETVADLDHPCSKMQHGPCGELGPDHAEICGEPCGKSPQQEPSTNPQDNPHSGRAREPGDQGFDALLAVWPETGLKRTHYGQARAAWAFACQLELAGSLLEAARRCAADPDMARGDYGWPGLHSWLSEERWRVWLPRPVAPAAAPSRTRFAGPEAIRAALVDAKGEAWVGSYLDPSDWDDEAQRVRPRTGKAAEELALVRRVIAEAAPGAGVGERASRDQSSGG